MNTPRNTTDMNPCYLSSCLTVLNRTCVKLANNAATK